MKPNVYRPGETVVITAEVTDADNVAATPSVSMKVRIADPEGTVVVESATMTEGDTGKYTYSAYDIPADAKDGKWPYECLATNGAGADVSIGSGFFVVKQREIAVP